MLTFLNPTLVNINDNTFAKACDCMIDSRSPMQHIDARWCPVKGAKREAGENPALYP